jgi:membrane associated rhomboid family serine protease
MAYSTYRFENPFGMSLSPWVRRLLLANTAVGVLQVLMHYGGQGGALESALAFRPVEVLSKPWSPLTYMFVHGDFWHFFFNMLVLFFFGPPLEERWGSTDFIKFYLVAGLGAALLCLLDPTSAVIGASGAVYGLMLAYAMAWPDNPVYIWGIFPVKVKWLVAALAAFSVFGAMGSFGSGVAHWAHLGGFATAFLYLKSPWAPSAWGPTYGKRATKKKGWRLTLPWKRKPKPAAAPPPKPQHAPGATIRRRDEQQLLDDVDRILEKISARGLASLTEEERRRLDEVSRRYRSD